MFEEAKTKPRKELLIHDHRDGVNCYDLLAQ